VSCVTRAELKTAPRTADSMPPSSAHARHSPAARLPHHAPRALTIVIPDLRFSPLRHPHHGDAPRGQQPALTLRPLLRRWRLVSQHPLCYDFGLLPSRLSPVDRPSVASPPDGPVAQLAEQQTLNLLVEGSTPSRFTSSTIVTPKQGNPYPRSTRVSPGHVGAVSLHRRGVLGVGSSLPVHPSALARLRERGCGAPPLGAQRA
jgi:hypothetical protein